MATHGNNASEWPFVILGLGAVAAFLKLNAWSAAYRRNVISTMAERLGLQPWPDDALPRGISLNRTVFESWSALRNVHEGTLRGRQVVVFDFRKQVGKSGWSRTIIAVRTKEPIALPPSIGLDQQRVGDWLITFSPVGFFRSHRLMDASEIELVINAISASSNPN